MLKAMLGQASHDQEVARSEIPGPGRAASPGADAQGSWAAERHQSDRFMDRSRPEPVAVPSHAVAAIPVEIGPTGN